MGSGGRVRGFLCRRFLGANGGPCTLHGRPHSGHYGYDNFLVHLGVEIRRINLPHIHQYCADYFLTYREEETWVEDGHNLKGNLLREGVAEIIIDDWLFRNGKEINLYAAIVMSNHVHAVFSIREGIDLFQLATNHKNWTAKAINRKLNRKGQFWQREYFDRIVRPGYLAAAIQYTLLNPVKAGLVNDWREWQHSYLSEEYQGLF